MQTTVVTIYGHRKLPTNLQCRVCNFRNFAQCKWKLCKQQNETRTRRERDEGRAERAIQITDISCIGCIWHFPKRNCFNFELCEGVWGREAGDGTEKKEARKKRQTASLKGATMAAAISSFYCCWQQLFTPLSHSWDARLLISHSGQELLLLLPIDCLSHTRAQRVCCGNNNSSNNNRQQ